KIDTLESDEVTFHSLRCDSRRNYGLVRSGDNLSKTKYLKESALIEDFGIPQSDDSTLRTSFPKCWLCSITSCAFTASSSGKAWCTMGFRRFCSTRRIKS